MGTDAQQMKIRGMQVAATEKDRRGGHEAARAQIQRLNAEGLSDPQHAAVAHGLYLTKSAFMSCDRCVCRRDCASCQAGGDCALEREYLPDRMGQMITALRQDGHDPILYGSLIEVAVICEIRVARGMRYLAERGEMVADAEGMDDYSGAAKELPRLIAAMTSALQQLNLTPAAQAKLRNEAPDVNPLAQAILAIDHARTAAANKEAIEADFESEDVAMSTGRDACTTGADTTRAGLSASPSPAERVPEPTAPRPAPADNETDDHVPPTETDRLRQGFGDRDHGGESDETRPDT